MLQATKILHQGHGLARSLLGRASTVELDWGMRQQSQFECTDSQGRQFGVFLPPGTVVRGGDVLVAEDGSMLRVVAAPQPVMIVRLADKHPAIDLLRAAYHLGRRHVPVQLEADHLKIEPDPALAAMLRGMHLVVTDTFAPFEPEGDACGHEGHAHEHEHAHHHGAPHTHEHEHDTELHDHEHDSHKHGEHGQSRGG